MTPLKLKMLQHLSTWYSSNNQTSLLCPYNITPLQDVQLLYLQEKFHIPAQILLNLLITVHSEVLSPTSHFSLSQEMFLIVPHSVLAEKTWTSWNVVQISLLHLCKTRILNHLKFERNQDDTKILILRFPICSNV